MKGIKNLVLRPGTRLTRIDLPTTADNYLTLHHQSQVRSRIFFVLAQDNFLGDDFTAFKLLDLVDRNCAIEDTPYTRERATILYTEDTPR